MEKDWVLVANAHRARWFTRERPAAALTEIASFVYPQQRLGPSSKAGDVSGDAGKGHGRTAHAGTQFEPRHDVQVLEHQAFARQPAGYLDDAVHQKRCERVAVVASAPMLGELRSALSQAALNAMTNAVARDLTIYQGQDLQQRVDAALQEKA